MPFNVDFTSKSFLMWHYVFQDDADDADVADVDADVDADVVDDINDFKSFIKYDYINVTKIRQYMFGTQTNLNINELINETINNNKSIYLSVNSLNIESRINIFIMRSYGIETLLCIKSELAARISHRGLTCIPVSHNDLQDFGYISEIKCDVPQCDGYFELNDSYTARV
jgi:hypothetical protein